MEISSEQLIRNMCSVCSDLHIILWKDDGKVGCGEDEDTIRQAIPGEIEKGPTV